MMGSKVGSLEEDLSSREVRRRMKLREERVGDEGAWKVGTQP